ncbi:hypothetical protein [Spirosoma linguale]|uniref:hypothetical protein n=1 Tax=Spirosoma linguale TaxID=108 RepID=UPI0001A3AC51
MVETEQGLSFLSEAIIDTHLRQRSRFPRLTKALQRNPGLLVIGLCTDSGLVMSQGNVLRAIGSGGVFMIDSDNIKDTIFHAIPELQSVYVSNLRVNILAQGASCF